VPVFDLLGFIPHSNLGVVRCHTPRSPLAIRTFERRSVLGSACTKRILIAFQRLDKSASPGGKLQAQCMWSGNNPGIDMKQPLAPCRPHRLTQHINEPNQRIKPSLQQLHSKKTLL